jgi:hypothetical protein
MFLGSMGACVVLKGFIEYAAVILIFRAQAVRVHEPSATSNPLLQASNAIWDSYCILRRYDHISRSLKIIQYLYQTIEQL